MHKWPLTYSQRVIIVIHI